jgi:hypothetical protein
MKAQELLQKLKQVPPDSEVEFDDLGGGRIPIQDVRLEPRLKFDQRPGVQSLPAVVLVAKTGLEHGQ